MRLVCPQLRHFFLSFYDLTRDTYLSRFGWGGFQSITLSLPSCVLVDLDVTTYKAGSPPNPQPCFSSSLCLQPHKCCSCCFQLLNIACVFQSPRFGDFSMITLQFWHFMSFINFYWYFLLWPSTVHDKGRHQNKIVNLGHLGLWVFDLWLIFCHCFSFLIVMMIISSN